jgi:hypothetical protein
MVSQLAKVDAATSEQLDHKVWSWIGGVYLNSPKLLTESEACVTSLEQGAVYMV